MTKHTLLALDGSLYFPEGGEIASPSLLLKIYDAGDVDTCPWPMHSEFCTQSELRQRLASALFDERECNSAYGPHDTIELPDGTPFDPDMELSSGDRTGSVEQHENSGDWGG